MKPSSQRMRAMYFDAVGRLASTNHGGYEGFCAGFNIGYAAGQKDQREKDVGICYAMAASYETCHANRCADAIRSQSNED